MKSVNCDNLYNSLVKVLFGISSMVAIEFFLHLSRLFLCIILFFLNFTYLFSLILKLHNEIK